MAITRRAPAEHGSSRPRNGRSCMDEEPTARAGRFRRDHFVGGTETALPAFAFPSAHHAAPPRGNTRRDHPSPQTACTVSISGCPRRQESTSHAIASTRSQRCSSLSTADSRRLLCEGFQRHYRVNGHRRTPPITSRQMPQRAWDLTSPSTSSGYPYPRAQIVRRHPIGLVPDPHIDQSGWCSFIHGPAGSGYLQTQLRHNLAGRALQRLPTDNRRHRDDTTCSVA